MSRAVWGILLLAGCSTRAFIEAPASGRTEVVVVSNEANTEVIAAVVRALDDPAFTLTVDDERVRQWNVVGVDREPCDLGLDRGPLRLDPQAFGGRRILDLVDGPSSSLFHGSSTGPAPLTFYPGTTLPQQVLLTPLAPQACDQLISPPSSWTPQDFGLEGSFQSTRTLPPIPQLATSGSRIALLVFAVPLTDAADLVFLDTASGRWKVVHGVHVTNDSYAVDLSQGPVARALVVADDTLTLIDEAGTILATALTPGGRSERLVLPSYSGDFVYVVSPLGRNDPNEVVQLRTSDLSRVGMLAGQGEVISGSASGPEGLTVLTKNGRLVQHPRDLSDPTTLHLGRACGTSSVTYEAKSVQRYQDGWVVILANRFVSFAQTVAVIRPAELRSRPVCTLIDAIGAIGLSPIPGREDRGALLLERSAGLVDLGGEGSLGAVQNLNLPMRASYFVDDQGGFWTLTAGLLQRYTTLPRPEVGP